MTPNAIIERLNSVGITIAADEKGLVFGGNRDAFSPELRALVADHRDELVRGVRVFAGFSPIQRAQPEPLSLSLSNISTDSQERENPATPAYPADDPHPVAYAEIRSLPIAWTRDLPAPCTLVVAFPHPTAASGPSLLTTSARRRAEALSAGQAVWAIGELELAAYALQEGRATVADVLGWDKRKRTRWPEAVDAAKAMAGAWGLLDVQRAIPAGALRLTWGEWLDAMGARLLDVVCESLAAPTAQGATSAAAESDEVVL